jgi:shikimate 5-dehydrogenase
LIAQALKLQAQVLMWDLAYQSLRLDENLISFYLYWRKYKSILDAQISVLIPVTLDVIILLDKLTPAAEAIGAVNIVIPKSRGSVEFLTMTTLDWRQILHPSKRWLVIGAGGTARVALHSIYNRTTG